MSFQGDVLNGTCEEFITKVHMGRSAVLSGRMDGDKIWFVKQYPCFFEFDEHEGIHLDRSRDAYPVHYTGTFHPTLGVFSGDWRISRPSEEGRAESDPFSGSWEMWKI